MTITQLQIFVEVAQIKSFTQAARNINLTQSAVSHAIANLETEFGLTCPGFLVRNFKLGCSKDCLWRRRFVS